MVELPFDRFLVFLIPVNPTILKPNSKLLFQNHLFFLSSLQDLKLWMEFPFPWLKAMG